MASGFASRSCRVLFDHARRSSCVLHDSRGAADIPCIELRFAQSRLSTQRWNRRPQIEISAQALADDVDPFGIEKEHFISSKARAEVAADLRAAQAAGQVPIPGELGVKFVDAQSIKPRAQVVAETLEAKRLGLISYGELESKQPTPAQERQIEMAGKQALERMAAAKRAAGQSGG